LVDATIALANDSAFEFLYALVIAFFDAQENADVVADLQIVRYIFVCGGFNSS